MLIESEQYILGYGSLLSHGSRLRYSNLDCQVVPVTVTGWQRAWNTRSFEEKQTYLGAETSDKGQLNAVILPIPNISPELEKREQDYEFVAVNLDNLLFHIPIEQQHEIKQKLQSKPIWICHNRCPIPADCEYPIYQSYVDTCLAGCIETNLTGFVELFVNTTQWWDGHWVNDRHNPKYPRAVSLDNNEQKKVDELFSKIALLENRREEQ